MSTFMARMLFTVSMSVSPFLVLLLELLKLRMSALSRFSASSKLIRVRVLFSKKRLAMVMSRREGTFLMGRASTSLNPSAVRKMSSMSCTVRSSIPSRWSTLSRSPAAVPWCSLVLMFLGPPRP